MNTNSNMHPQPTLFTTEMIEQELGARLVQYFVARANACVALAEQRPTIDDARAAIGGAYIDRDRSNNAIEYAAWRHAAWHIATVCNLPRPKTQTQPWE